MIIKFEWVSSELLSFEHNEETMMIFSVVWNVLSIASQGEPRHIWEMGMECVCVYTKLS